MCNAQMQARRQELAAGGPKTRRRGQKTEGGPHFKNTVLDVCSNRGAKREMGGAPISNGGPGTTGPPAGDGPAQMSCYFHDTAMADQL